METTIILVYSILIAAATILLLFCICSCLTLKKNYKYYKLTADALSDGGYVYNEYLSKYSDIVYYRKHDADSLFSDDEILFFKNGTIKLLGKNSYIHDALFTYFDPYTMYWRNRIFRIFKGLENERRSNTEATEQLKQL